MYRVWENKETSQWLLLEFVRIGGCFGTNTPIGVFKTREEAEKEKERLDKLKKGS